MRGDSLRDLYAKSLAVVGLAALAGVGAVIDYWPADLNVPSVASAAMRPAVHPAAPLHLNLADLRIPAPAPAVPVLPAALVVSAPVVPVPFTDTASPDVLLAVRVAPPPVMPVGVATSMPDAPAVAISTPPAVEPAQPPVVVEQHADADQSFVVVSALKKTGSSLGSSLVKTGATVASAFRALGGAFKRIL